MPLDTINFDGRQIWGGRSGTPIQTTHIDYDRRQIDFSDDIAYYFPEATPFLSILLRVAKATTGSPEFVWWDKDRPEWWTKLADSYDDSDDSIEVDDAHFLNPKDIIKNVETGENMFIESIDYGDGTDGADVLNVKREVTYDSDADWGTEATASDGSEDEILKLGNAMEENSRAPESWATQPKKRFNYVQHFRTPFDGSNDQDAEGVKAGPDERVRLRSEKMVEHMIDMERQFMFGERKEWYDEDKDKIRRTSGGILQFIQEGDDTLVYDLGAENNGALTETEFKNYCSEAFRYGSKSKLFLCSRIVAQALDEHAADRIQTSSGEEEYGLKLRRYKTTHGNVLIATTELFERAYGNMGLMLDIDNIEVKVFDGQDSTLHTNIQENDRDGWKDEYRTKAGLKVELVKTHSILEGVEAA